MNKLKGSFAILVSATLGTACGANGLGTSRPGAQGQGGTSAAGGLPGPGDGGAGGVLAGAGTGGASQAAGGSTAVGGSAAAGGSTAAGGASGGNGGSTLGSGSSDSTWIDRTTGTTAGGMPWRDVASDATGIHLVAVTTVGTLNPDGNIWTSADGGATWTNRTAGTAAAAQYWKSVASDSTGTHLVAVTLFTGIRPGGEDVWTSADSGATWTKRTTVNSTAGGVVGPTVASDATGAHLVLADGDIWKSDDAGATWTDQTAGTPAAAQSWADMASDSSATHLVAITVDGDIWTSADAGATWTNRTKGTQASRLDWQAVASDSTGTHLVAACAPSVAPAGGLDQGDIWVSSDSGATWTNRTQGTAASASEWASVASDATGTHLVAACAHARANDIWTSADSGMTWTNATAGTSASGQEWIVVASDAAGTHLVAASIDPAPPSDGITSMPCCFGDIWTN